MALSQAEIDLIVSQIIQTLANTAKISELPTGALLAGAEEFEANNAGISVKYNTTEIATFIGASLDLQTAYDGGPTINITAINTPFELIGANAAANQLIKIVDDLGRDVLIQDRNNPILKSRYDIELKAPGVAPNPVWGNHGAVTMFKWNSTLQAFRGGEVTSTQWDELNIGTLSWAWGKDANASGDGSFAFGENVEVSGNNSFGFGDGSSPLTVPLSNFFSFLFTGGGTIDVAGGSLNVKATGPIGFTVGTTPDLVKLSKLGLLLTGTARYKKQIVFSASSVSGGGLNPPTDVVLFGNKVAKQFANAQEEEFFLSGFSGFIVDTTENVEIQVLWSPANVDAGICEWKLDLSITTPGSTINNAITTISIDSTAPGVSDILTLSPAVTTPGTNFAQGDLLSARFYRPNTDPFTGNANFFSIVFTAVANKLGGPI